MADASSEMAAWREGYEAALRDLEDRVGKLQERGQAAGLRDVLAELRAGLTTGQHLDPVARQAAGVPPEELEREWTAG
jgi:hypothetical protein